MAVSQGDGAGALDITRGLEGYGLAGLNAAITHARESRISLAQFLASLADASEEMAAVDMAKGTHAGKDGSASAALPVQAPEVWGSGVTYRRSREAREAENVVEKDFYSRIYTAERPEIFFKDSSCRRTVGPNGRIGIRGDSRSSVPEPELALVLDASGTVVGFTLGNDVTARDIESQNPLYLPQAKIFAKSCALGPCLLLCDTDPDEVAPFPIEMSIRSAMGEMRYQDSTSTAELTRRFADLVGYLTRHNPIADGTVLLTGTGLVPPPDFALQDGDVVTITSAPIGSLENTAVDLARTAEGSPMANSPSSIRMEDLP
ncbi:fumarylacetoacetate hydrolase family protein [Arthrobacter sp. GCM10027362]|uniref:fumarylacetoacetate hydrolase family protein n=1 Tax=Arthrobacter sp. GCM10027362 TaxID=3273379 RepID=UPI00362F3FCA